MEVEVEMKKQPILTNIGKTKNIIQFFYYNIIKFFNNSLLCKRSYINPIKYNIFYY